MSNSFQYIPFPVPDYLAQYFAYKIRSQIVLENDVLAISVNRHSYLGKVIHRSMEADKTPIKKRRHSNYYLKISNYSADHFPGTPSGTHNFLDVRVEVIDSIIEVLKMDFNQALIAFVEGAEFAHLKTGWSRNQKRKGIRKAAILEFCRKHHVSEDEISLQTLLKLCQRHKKYMKQRKYPRLKKFTELLSL